MSLLFHDTPRKAARRLICLGIVAVLTAVAMPRETLRAQAQGEPDNPYDGDGVHENRSYLSLLPYEHIDTLNGNLVLTFTDLVLPGNAGFDLRFQRTYNSKRSALWSFGIAGIPMRVLNAEYVAPPNAGDEPLFPILVTADGGRHPSRPVTQSDNNYVATKEFWRYRRDVDKVELPNGLVGTYGDIDDRNIAPGVPYGNNVRYLTEIADPFGNTVALTWTMTDVVPVLTRVVQNLGNDQTRTVILEPGPVGMTASISYNGRTWNYHYNDALQLDWAQPPVGPKWQYGYTDGALTSLTTPNGGVVEYAYTGHVFEWRDMRGGGTRPITTRVVQQRKIGTATWTFVYPPELEPEKETTISGPSNTVKVRYGYSGGVDSTVNRRIVLDGTTEVEKEETSYQTVPFVDWGADGEAQRVSVPLARTFTRDGQAWTTTHTYAETDYGDYGQPWRTEETGTAGTRTTTRTFTHEFTPWIRGVVASETITVGSDPTAFTKTFVYDTGTGFRESATIYGVTTTFAPTATGGNVASASHNHGGEPAVIHMTNFGYAWGTVASIDTPEYDITREVNPDGTIKSETRGGHKTDYFYDPLQRLERVNPDVEGVPSLDIVTTYGATSVTVTRGVSVTTTTLDGFGRPIGTKNAEDVETKTAYDVEGRTTYASYPFYTGSGDTGETFHYDGLGRVTQIDRPGPCEPAPCRVTIEHDGLEQTITDEQGRATEQRWEAFGDPGAARFASLTDAAAKVWTYTYHALGGLAAVDAPGAHGTRSWSYGTDHLLDAETHPESGTTTYTYDGGRLWQRRDARGKTFQHYYDDNDRLTWVEVVNDNSQDLRFGYSDADNRTSMSSAGVSTSVVYDAANRLRSRTDTIGSRAFTVGYDYDLRDNLIETTYPGGREVVQAYDAANRVTGVTDRGGATYAQAIAYHANGVLASYTAGNGIAHSVTLTGDGRQRVQDVNAAPIALTYGYDHVGNVTSLDDRSARNRDSTFGYDALDRLDGVTGFGATSYTYDDYGNRRTKPGVTYVYDEGSQRLTHDGTAVHGHDNNGNTTTIGSATYGYSPHNMMTSATVAGATTAYAYDADGQRRRRVGASGTEYFIHGPGYVPLAEYTEADGTLTWQRDYIYAGSRLIASVAPATGGTPTYTFTDDPLVAGTTTVKAAHLTELRAAVNTARALWNLPAATWTDPTVTAGATLIRLVHVAELRAAIDAAYVAANATLPTYTDPTLTAGVTPVKAAHLQELRAAVRALPAPTGGGTSFYHLDALASVRAVTAADGSVVRRHDYLPFGEEYEPEPGTDARRFTGKERDPESGLDYFSARHYGTGTGRFMQADDSVFGDIVNPQSLNRYAYTLNNPLRFVDPTGHQAACPTDYCVTVTARPPNDATLRFWNDFTQRRPDPLTLLVGDIARRSEPIVPVVGAFVVSAHLMLSFTNPVSAAIAGCVVSGSECASGPTGMAMALSPKAVKILGNLASLSGKTVAQVIRLRGGGGSQVNKVATDLQHLSLGEVAERAAAGDPAAKTAIKIAKDAKRLGGKY